MLRTGGFKPPYGKNKRLSDAKTFRFGGIVRLKDACTFLAGTFSTRCER